MTPAGTKVTKSISHILGGVSYNIGILMRFIPNAIARTALTLSL